MERSTTRQAYRQRRQKRIRASISGTASRPRLAVFRSLKHITVQLIDDQAGKTLVSASDATMKKGTKSERAAALGKLVAEQAMAKKITTVIFDRGGNRYHGRVKAFGDAARAGGLVF